MVWSSPHLFIMMADSSIYQTSNSTALVGSASLPAMWRLAATSASSNSANSPPSRKQLKWYGTGVKSGKSLGKGHH